MKTFAFLIAASLTTPTSAFLATSSSPAAVVVVNGVTINSRLSMASSSSTGTDESVVPIVVTPNPVIKLAANGMSLLGPIFALEANLQAALLGSLTNVDEEAVLSNIEYMKNTNDVLIYTYGLSPFSSEAMSILDASEIEYTKIELGMEWFLLGGEGSVTRVALSKEVENGATSLPKIFIGGVCIGGCAELANLVERGELVEMVKRAKKVASTSKKGGGGKGGGGSGNFLTKMFM